MEVAGTCAPCRDETVAVPASLTCEFVWVGAASLVAVPWLAAPSAVLPAVWVAAMVPPPRTPLKINAVPNSARFFHGKSP